MYESTQYLVFYRVLFVFMHHHHYMYYYNKPVLFQKPCFSFFFFIISDMSASFMLNWLLAVWAICVTMWSFLIYKIPYKAH